MRAHIRLCSAIANTHTHTTHMRAHTHTHTHTHLPPLVRCCVGAYMTCTTYMEGTCTCSTRPYSQSCVPRRVFPHILTFSHTHPSVPAAASSPCVSLRLNASHCVSLRLTASHCVSLRLTAARQKRQKLWPAAMRWLPSRAVQSGADPVLVRNVYSRRRRPRSGSRSRARCGTRRRSRT